jgi:hypothetical protein
MGTGKSGVAINEAVFLLSKTAPEKLISLRNLYPDIAEELREGIYAGEKEEMFIIEKAEFVTVALEEVSSLAKVAMVTVAVIIQRARSRRLISQMLVLIGSSSLLGAVALDGKTATVISAVLTLLAAIGNLLAEHYERLLNPQTGNIYEAFQKLGEGSYKARAIAADLKLSIRHKVGEIALKEQVGKANELCEELNGWLIQLLSQFPISSATEPTKTLTGGQRR